MSNDERKNRKIFFLLCMQVAVLHAGQSMIIPILPLFAKSFGVSLALVGALLALQAVPRLFVSMPAGRLTDRFGAHRLLTVACLISVVAATMSAFAPTFAVLVVARVIQAVATAAAQTAGLTYAATLGGKGRRGRRISTYQGSFLLGNSIGPVIGGVLAQAYGYRIPFAVFACAAGTIAIWTFLKLPDPRAASDPAGSRSDRTKAPKVSLLSMLASGAILTACMMGLLSAFTRSGSRDYALVVLSHEREIPTGRIGLALSLLFAANVAVMYLIGSLTDRYGVRAVMIPSWMIVGASLVILASVDTTAGLIIAALLYGFGVGFGNSVPAVQIANSVEDGSRGSALGLFRTFSDLGLVIGASVVAVFAATIGVVWSVWINAVLVFAAALLYAVRPPPSIRKPSQSS